MGKFSSLQWANRRVALRRRQAGWLLLGACWLSTGSLAQAEGSRWQWQDSQGRKVFSDMPPPASVPEQRILQRPGPELPAPSQPSASSNPPTSAGNDQPQGKAPEPLYQRNAAALRENCRRARSTLATLASSLRLYSLNEKGEQVLMDDAMRAQETQRAQQAERDNCEPKAERALSAPAQ